MAVNIGQKFGSPIGTTTPIGDLISTFLTIAITIAGIIVLFFFVSGGIQIIRGAGSNDPKSTADGKQAVTYALIGFIIIFVSFWVIRAIELTTGTRFITAPSFTNPGASGGLL